MTPLNDKRFEHLTRAGILVEAERCDLKGGVVLHARERSTDVEIAQAAAQAFGYHAANILPRLNGFAGYDCVTIEIVRVNY
ncbi:MAG: hypothetical protein IPK59_23280 [Rhodospirillaceae bacterium]|nr:hypothetical protein [Rhodospirillaceae bacterium]